MSRLSMHLPPDPSAPGVARRRVAALLEQDGVEAEPAEAALLVLSELVTNAVTHARSDVVLVVEIGRDLIRLEVSDDSTTAPSRRVPDKSAPGGWGMNLIDVMSTQWGFGPRADGLGGKTVWVHLPLAA
jgi:anti-sigma regulatory factor (Ser/Thr protein kinase)